MPSERHSPTVAVVPRQRPRTPSYSTRCSPQLQRVCTSARLAAAWVTPVLVDARPSDLSWADLLLLAQTRSVVDRQLTVAADIEGRRVGAEGEGVGGERSGRRVPWGEEASGEIEPTDVAAGAAQLEEVACDDERAAVLRH